MPSLREKKLAKALVENATSTNPLKAGELLESVGYAPLTAQKRPGNVIQQVGVQKELEKLGFSEAKAKEVVGRILTDQKVKPDTRLKAADMTFKVFGSYAPDKSISASVDLTREQAHSDEVKRLREEFEAKLYEATKSRGEAI